MFGYLSAAYTSISRLDIQLYNIGIYVDIERGKRSRNLQESYFTR